MSAFGFGEYHNFWEQVAETAKGAACGEVGEQSVFYYYHDQVKSKQRHGTVYGALRCRIIRVVGLFFGCGELVSWNGVCGLEQPLDWEIAGPRG